MRKHLMALPLPLLLALAPRVGAATFTLSVSTAGPLSSSVIYSSNPATGINCGSTSTACSAVFAASATVTLTQVTGSSVVFAGWGGYGPCGSNYDSCSVVMYQGHALAAQYNPVLSLSLSGNGAGSVTDASGTIECASGGTCASGAATTQAYAAGSYVTLTASAAPNSYFTGWTGAGCATGPCQFHMSGYQVVVATFNSAGPFQIAVSFGGTGKGFVSSSPGGISCYSTGTACSASFAADETVTLTAVAGASSTFAGWANAGCGSTGTCVILSTSAQQGLGGFYSPAASFY